METISSSLIPDFILLLYIAESLNWADPTGKRTIWTVILDPKPCLLARWTRSIRIQQDGTWKQMGKSPFKLLVCAADSLMTIVLSLTQKAAISGLLQCIPSWSIKPTASPPGMKMDEEQLPDCIEQRMIDNNVLPEYKCEAICIANFWAVNFFRILLSRSLLKNVVLIARCIMHAFRFRPRCRKQRGKKFKQLEEKAGPLK